MRGASQTSQLTPTARQQDFTWTVADQFGLASGGRKPPGSLPALRLHHAPSALPAADEVELIETAPRSAASRYRDRPAGQTGPQPRRGRSARQHGIGLVPVSRAGQSAG